MRHDPAAWASPDWFTALDRARMARAVDAAERRRTLPQPVVLTQFRYPSETAAIDAAIGVLFVLADVLRGHHADHAAELPAAWRRLRDDVVVWVNASRWPTTDAVDAFAVAVMAALETQPWWRPFLQTITQTAAASDQRHPDPVTLKAAREDVVLPLLEELEWKPSTWAAKAGVRPDSALRYLDGTSTPHRDTRRHLTNVLRLALKLPTTFKLPD